MMNNGGDGNDDNGLKLAMKDLTEAMKIEPGDRVIRYVSRWIYLSVPPRTHIHNVSYLIA